MIRDHKQDSLKHFNRIAGRYDRHRYGKQTRKVHVEVKYLIDQFHPASLLDVGCGNGGFLSLVQAEHRALAGADLSPEMIKHAKQRLGESVDLRVADSEQLPWNGEQFDCLTCNYSFHHYPNPKQVLLEMRRVLKVGGHLVICDPWFPNPFRSLANFAMRYSSLGDVKMHSLPEWRSLLSAAGFQIAQLYHRGVVCYVVADKPAA